MPSFRSSRRTWRLTCIRKSQAARHLQSAHPLEQQQEHLLSERSQRGLSLAVIPLRDHAAAWGSPVQLAGVGATIGIVMSSVISPADLASAFNSDLPLGGGEQPHPGLLGELQLAGSSVTVHPVMGGSGAFNPSPGATEASLDTQMSLGTAPGAKEILYDMPSLNDDAITAAYTQVVEENAVDIVSSSFGECELDFTAAPTAPTSRAFSRPSTPCFSRAMRRASLSWQARATMARWTACQRRSITIRRTARILW